MTQIRLFQLSTLLKKYVEKISLCQNSNFNSIKLIFSIFKFLFFSTHKIKIKNNLILILIHLNLIFNFNSNSTIKIKIFSMFNEKNSLNSSFNLLFKLWNNKIEITIENFLIQNSSIIVTIITTIITTTIKN